MQAKRLPAHYGWKWIVEGLRLWRRSPVTLTMTTITMTMLIVGTSLVPFLGEIAMPVVLGPLEVGMFMLCAKVDQSQVAAPTILFSGFRRQLPQLVALGILRLAGNLFFLAIAVAITGVDFSRARVLVMGGGDAAVEFVQQYVAMMGLFFLLRIPVEMASWFAPLLIGLRGLPVIKSLFFSFVACWRNIQPILMYLVSLIVVFATIPSLIIAVLAMVAPAVASALMVPLLVLITPLFFASFYRSAMDIFDNGF